MPNQVEDRYKFLWPSQKSWTLKTVELLKKNAFHNWTVEPFFSNDREKPVQGLRPRIRKSFEITRTICSNNNRQEQFLEHNAFLTWSKDLIH